MFKAQNNKITNILLVIMLLTVISSCKRGLRSNRDPDPRSQGSSITAAGATFPMLFYNIAFKKYTQSGGIPVTYGGIGSGGGIRSLSDKIVDFGATDAFLSDKELSEMPADVVHIPTCMGAVVVAYNVPGVDSLKLTPRLLESIFMGSITRWTDPEISSVNPGISFPDMEITVIYRSDGSGTTHIFSDYMSKVSKIWSDEIGTGKALKWPAGMGAKGNPGVAGIINQAPGSIGYVGSEYAFALRLKYAAIRNKSGNYILPDIKSVSSAANITIPPDSRIMVTDSDDPGAYPISGFTWIILFREQSYNGRTFSQAGEVAKLLQWLISDDAQGIAESVNYAPLSDVAAEIALNSLKTLTFEGRRILEQLERTTGK